MIIIINVTTNNNNQCLLSAYCMLDTILSALISFSHQTILLGIIFIIVLQKRNLQLRDVT